MSRYPRGKLTKDDEGELAIAIGHKDSAVVIDFGKPVVWIGFPPDQADQLADKIKQCAALARKGEPNAND